MSLAQVGNLHAFDTTTMTTNLYHKYRKFGQVAVCKTHSKHRIQRQISVYLDFYSPLTGCLGVETPIYRLPKNPS